MSDPATNGAHTAPPSTPPAADTAAASVWDEYQATAGDPLDAPPPTEIEAYTADEVAALVSALSAYGVPAERLDDYQRAVLARTKPALELLDVGDALLAYGVGKGGAGFSALPPWARLVAGVGIVGAVVFMTRKEHGAGGLDATGADAGGAAAGEPSGGRDGGA